MIGKFLNERKSWIGLFIAFEILLLFMANLDPNLSITSIGYFVFLSTVIFVLFLIIRYNRETKFYQSIDEQSDDFDTSDMQHPTSPFEKMVAQRLSQQYDQLRKIETENRIQLEEEKDELLSWIHEVKTPLSAMHLIIDRLEDRNLKAQLDYEWLRIHLLLDQQLHQKRMSVIESDLYMEEVELEPLIHEEVRALRSWCMYKKIGFDIELEEKSVLSDAKWLSFIIRQLLSNAVKYSENADIVIHTRRVNDKVTLSIQDDGQGIESKDLPRIFDKGFTSTSAHQNHAATGMGLYLAKQATDALHITVDVISSPEKGSTFNLIFPKKNDMVEVMTSY